MVYSLNIFENYRWIFNIVCDVFITFYLYNNYHLSKAHLKATRVY